MPRLSLLSVALLSVAAASAGAQTVQKTVSLEVASQIAAQGVAACAAGGHSVTVAVVDRAGQLKALARADNAGPHSIDSARRKAYTAASMRNATGAIMENMQKNPAAANLWQIDGIIGLAGGLPIRIGAEVIGGVGVGGAPGGHLDEQCAAAALDKVKDLLK